MELPSNWTYYQSSLVGVDLFEATVAVFCISYLLGLVALAGLLV